MKIYDPVLIWIALLQQIQDVSALPYDPEQVGFNLNQNQTATDPLEYWGEWRDHTYHPSPRNWRIPFYSVFLDRFVNGDPSNDDANGTQWEHDLLSNQFRHGGDVLGLMDSFDYLQGMGVEALYFAGAPYINEPWGADGYSPLDLTLLDHHFGSIDDWRTMIAEAHRRGLYIIFENTMATLGDLIGFEGYMNTSAPLNPYEYNYQWKTSRHYHDFTPGNDWLNECEYPRFWDDLGRGITETTLVKGCRDSEFDQYGEIASFGTYTEWERQIAKFAFVQDRLREWRPDVRHKIEHFSCITIAMLDIDGFRIDKALQVTLDAQGDWSDYIRRCARRFGKDNFYIPGEIVSGNSFGALYIGRGQQVNQTIANITEAMSMSNATVPGIHLRPSEKVALDAAAFHYTVYRALARFLGMDGTFEAEGDPPTNFVDLWNGLVQTNDMVNTNTGKYDPRHLYGTSNQDVFRWPSIRNGTEKQVLALYVISLLLPGIPILTWGEEQAFYLLDNSNANYVFGRSPMSSTQAWQLHGCYKVGSVKYHDFPIDSAAWGCMDDNVSLDHRDPTHPVRGLVRTMFETRKNYPVLKDGYYLEQLSNMTYDIYLPGSNGTPTEMGMWSVLRSRFDLTQDFTGTGQGNQSVWLVYQNDNRTVNYRFNCSDSDEALISPFDEGTTVKNLLPPFEEFTLESSNRQLRFEGSKKFNGCLPNMSLPAWGFKAFVPKNTFVSPSPFVTKFKPGHDWRILSAITTGERIPINFEFSEEMDCGSITNGLSVTSSARDNQKAQFDKSTVSCNVIPRQETTFWEGALSGVFNYSVELENVFHGVHEVILKNVTNKSQNRITNAVDHFILRIGSTDNPMVWPKQANYSRELLYADDSNNGTLWVAHKAAGAEKWRYTLDFGSSFSPWMSYAGGNVSIPPKDWAGTKAQAWSGEHVMVQYWNKVTGSSDHYQHGDVAWDDRPPRRYPNFWVQGGFNQFGFDSGFRNQMSLTDEGLWEYTLMTEWPAQVALNAWGVDANGQPDITQVLGDVDGDRILDRIPPISLLSNFINITDPPPWPFLSWKLSLNDGNLQIFTTPQGNQKAQLALFILLGVVPLLTAAAAVRIYLKSFYQVKFNKLGLTKRRSWPGNLMSKNSTFRKNFRESINVKSVSLARLTRLFHISSPVAMSHGAQALVADADAVRKTVLIATMEYDIEDWGIKIKIGGLGVMAQLMAKNLGHQNLIWVVPCVGGIEYPVDQKVDPFEVRILGQVFQIQVQYHVIRNITYVLLDAPIFRAQSTSEPYPVRMDDLDSAIYYSAWNSCIAETLKRFPADLYHINDFHGAAAPLHLLPETIPCCLSLHNAEFQGFWPMRTQHERQEVCEVFNLDLSVIERYVQFGDVFNLLHAAASYLYVHQNGFGAVAVSKKYGRRSWARYPIFWGLKEVGSLTNPDPSDTADWTREETIQEVQVDSSFEQLRVEMKRHAQEWAGLHDDPEAELFVFVGRWSMQKGVDLIADVFPSILETYSNVQLICVGPVIDLYGRFAAIKLSKMMDLFPGRVFSKPEFTALPPFIFSGAEFALIPSRDEPFGLVAVEFGRKGALGVGSRVGGLGQMPGWWYTIESMTTKHLIRQLKQAIHEALGCTSSVRAIMRARSGKQRFPVAQWVEDLDKLHSLAIERHRKFSKYDFRTSWTPKLKNNIPSRRKSSEQAERGLTAHKNHSPRPLLYLRDLKKSSHQGLCRKPILQALRLLGIRPEKSLQKIGLSPQDNQACLRSPTDAQPSHSFSSCVQSSGEAPILPPLLLREGVSLSQSDSPSTIGTNTSVSSGSTTPNPSTGFGSLLNHPVSVRHQHSSDLSLLSVDGIVREKQDFSLQKVNPFFTDSSKVYSTSFEKKLCNLNGKNSEGRLCIEKYLSKSEKDWFSKYRDVRMGRSPLSETSLTSFFRIKVHSTTSTLTSSPTHTGGRKYPDEFALPDDYVPPSGVKRFLLRRIGDWPLYSILLALGQIIAANSYQVTLLNGEIGEPAKKLYIIATIYLGASIVWWILFRSMKSIFVLSLPFLFYGSAFLFVGFSSVVSGSVGRAWMQNAATGFYAFASSSGSLFFALNFGDEGSAPVSSWVYRACVVQGSQQIYITFLWFWGSKLASASQAGSTRTSLADSNPHLLLGIGIGIAGLLWAVGLILFLGLPEYYGQVPGNVPAFYRTLWHRKIIMWFFYAVLIQNYWLSAPYGRNWLYLWSSKHAHPWEIIILVIAFFIGVWAAALWVFGVLSKLHAWFVPIFAIGLGAPRWCQMLWSTSDIGAYLPWTGGPITSALVGRGLWLWLGVLDALQGVGFGMILLNTLTRFHIAFTLLAAQVIGSVGTILARATAPNKVGPGDVFPDFSAGILTSLSKADFWVCLLFMLSINVFCFMFFRKEQLQKP